MIIERERQIGNQVFVTFGPMDRETVRLAEKKGVKIGTRHYAFSAEYYEEFKKQSEPTCPSCGNYCEPDEDCLHCEQITDANGVLQ